MPTHYGPTQYGLHYPGVAELEDIESRIFYSDHTQDEALRGYLDSQLSAAAFLPSEKITIKTDTSYNSDEIRD